MELTPENAAAVYHQPISVVKTVLPEIFRRIRRPREQQGQWLQDYVAWLRQMFLQYYISNMGQPVGWDGFAAAAVEAGVVETIIEFALQPVNESTWIAIFNGLDGLCYLTTTSNLRQRRIIFDRLVKCNALDSLMKIIRGHELNLHRYIAIRYVRSMVADMFLPEILPPEKTAELVEFFTRWTIEDEPRWMEQARKPAQSWQVAIMTSKLMVTNSFSVAYGKRWYGMTQEFAMWSTYGLLCPTPGFSRQYMLEVIKARPVIIDLLLDVAALPRPVAYPECQIDQLASESLAIIFQFPRYMVPGLKPPLSGKMKETWESDYNDTVAVYKILTSRPRWRARILSVFQRLDNEKWEDVQKLMSRVVSEYHGVPPDENTTKMMYESRGQARISMLRLVAYITCVDSVTVGDLVSFLRVAYLSTHAAIKHNPSERIADARTHREFCERTERDTECYRHAAWAIVMNADSDPSCVVPEAGTSSPIALLRLLAALAARGALAEIPRWAALPGDAAPGTQLGQVQQIASDAVVRRLLPLVLKRADHLRTQGRDLAVRDLRKARERFIPGAELNHCLLALDAACGGQWTKIIAPATKELVLCLGNAAEMSIRLKQYDAALVSAVAADAAAKKAAAGEIEAATLEKNKRRIETASKGFGVEPGRPNFSLGRPSIITGAVAAVCVLAYLLRRTFARPSP